MEYMVMECHPSYAVVMDRQGRFCKVANLGYEVGQRLDHVVQMRQPGENAGTRKRLAPVLGMAACLCIVLAGVWQLWLMSMGTVLIQINPQIQLSVNRMERVIAAEALNPDGAKVLFDCQPYGKTVEQAAQELSDRAAELGYLSDGGQVRLTVDSRDVQWMADTEHRLETVEVRQARNVTVFIGQADDDDLDDDDDDHWEHPDDDRDDPEEPDDDDSDDSDDDDWEDEDDDRDDDDDSDEDEDGD